LTRNVECLPWLLRTCFKQARCTALVELALRLRSHRVWPRLQVASALDFMHRHPLYKLSNRDVKASNVLIMTFEPGADGITRPAVKIADFGFADRDARKTRLGTAGCMAPEIYFLSCAL
jgi:Protein kinase domain